MRAKRIVRRLFRKLADYQNYRTVERHYDEQLSALKASIKESHPKLAIFIHLFYTDNWKLFRQKLNNIPRDVPYDIFITMPEANLYFESEIRSAFPDVHIITVKNRGRDVLPFIKIANVVSGAGYEYFLKFHSKKSTHWEGGQDWLEGMMERLLPNKKSSIKQIISTLENPDTGVVGPSDVYYSLVVNFPANGPHMTNVVEALFSHDTAHEILQVRCKEHGFFGGTMFWARFDAIETLLKYPSKAFERESGQIDATFAHALERLFSIVPQIENKEIYTVGEKGVVRAEYASGVIPEWSDARSD